MENQVPKSGRLWGVGAEPPTGGWTREDVFEMLRGVVDPELQLNIVDLGLVYDAKVEGGTVTVQMTLTSPGCPYGPMLVENVQDVVRLLKGVKKVEVELVWFPRWGPHLMTEDLRVELGFDVAEKGPDYGGI
jgi:metal-sulfur cluster biosynthetic enzyme